jgi:hypothetical protein
MRKSTIAALVGAVGLIVPGAAAVGSGTGTHQAARAVQPRAVAVQQAAVIFTPGTVTLSRNRQYATVRVQYQCSNNKLYKHYVTGSLQQGYGEGAVSYGIGWRGDGGIRDAKCTGRLVTETLRFARSSYATSQNDSLVSGAAELTFSVSRHNAPGHGPGWYTTHSTASVAKTTTVLTP